jgi:hypothetical protein
MQWFEAEELAAAALGMNEEVDSSAIENELWEKCDISFEQFQKVAELLLPLVISGTRAISNEPVRGFGKDGYVIVSCPQPSNNVDAIV